jgi:hypothetical protein
MSNTIYIIENIIKANHSNLSDYISNIKLDDKRRCIIEICKKGYYDVFLKLINNKDYDFAIYSETIIERNGGCKKTKHLINNTHSKKCKCCEFNIYWTPLYYFITYLPLYKSNDYYQMFRYLIDNYGNILKCRTIGPNPEFIENLKEKNVYLEYTSSDAMKLCYIDTRIYKFMLDFERKNFKIVEYDEIPNTNFIVEEDDKEESNIVEEVKSKISELEDKINKINDKNNDKNKIKNSQSYKLDFYRGTRMN